jgi:hypothetical protein
MVGMFAKQPYPCVIWEIIRFVFYRDAYENGQGVSWDFFEGCLINANENYRSSKYHYQQALISQFEQNEIFEKFNGFTIMCLGIYCDRQDKK